jgi:hypothetical protein
MLWTRLATHMIVEGRVTHIIGLKACLLDCPFSCRTHGTWSISTTSADFSHCIFAHEASHSLTGTL